MGPRIRQAASKELLPPTLGQGRVNTSSRAQVVFECVSVHKTTPEIIAGCSSFSPSGPPQTHILNYDLQMTNGLLIQFMNYVVVMVTLIKKQAPFSQL